MYIYTRNAPKPGYPQEILINTVIDSTRIECSSSCSGYAIKIGTMQTSSIPKAIKLSDRIPTVL